MRLRFLLVVFIAVWGIGSWATCKSARAGGFEGAFIVPFEMNASEIQPYLQQLYDTNHRIIVITSLVRKANRTNCSNQTQFTPILTDKIRTIVDFTDSHQMQLYFGLVESTCPFNSYPGGLEPNATTVINQLNSNLANNPLTYVVNNYGGRSSFAGWYISEEPALGNLTDSQYQQVKGYWKRYVEAIRTKSSKPILVAPSFCDADVLHLSPAMLAARALDFANYTGVDIQIWQDCVNQCGIALRNIAPDHRATTRDYYQAISSSIGRDRLWADLEINNCCMVPDGLVGGAYRATMMARMQTQLNNAPPEIAAKRLSWTTQFHANTVVNDRYDGADRLYAGLTIIQNPTASPYVLVTNPTYSWVTPPAVNYADTGNKLFDGVVGEVKNYSGYQSYLDPAYVGVVGPAQVNVDLQQTKNLKYIGVHTLNYNAAGIKFPSSLEMSCSTDNVNWQTKIYTHNAPLRDSELVLGTPNGEVIDWPCRYLRLKLNNQAGIFTFVSEVELIAARESGEVVPGDLTGDGHVTLADYNLLVSRYGNPYTLSDYNALVGNYGR